MRDNVNVLPSPEPDTLRWLTWYIVCCADFPTKMYTTFLKNKSFFLILVKTLILLFRKNKRKRQKQNPGHSQYLSAFSLALLSRSVSCKNPSFRAFFRILLSSLLILSLWSWKLWNFFLLRKCLS